MKNKKIVALLCAMAMIMVTLSSIFTVNAATAPKLSISIGDKDADNAYLVTVGYSECDGIIGSITAKIPVPEGVTVDAASVKVDNALAADIQANYDSEENEVIIAGAKLAGLFPSPSGDIATFKITVSDTVTSDVTLEFSNKTKMDDLTNGAASKVTFKVGASTNPIAVSSDSIEYQRPHIPAAPSFTLSSVKNADGSFTISVNYDISEMEKAEGADVAKIGSVSATISIPEGVTVDAASVKVEEKLAADIQANYDSEENGIIIAGAKLTGLFTAASGNVLTFNVTAANDAKIAFSKLKCDDMTSGKKVTIKMADINYNSVKVGPNAVEEPTPAPTTPADEPTTAPTDTPATEMPIKVEVSNYTASSDIIGKNKAVSVKLTDIDVTGVPSGKVDIVIQGFDGNTPCGNVIIPGIDVTNTSLTDLSFAGYVEGASKYAVNVYDNADSKVVLAKRATK